MIFRGNQLYNSHDNVVYVPKKTKKKEVPEERLFCKIEDFPKQIMVSAAIYDETSIFLLKRI